MISDDVINVFLLFMIVVNIITIPMIMYNDKKMLDNIEKALESLQKKFNEKMDEKK